MELEFFAEKEGRGDKKNVINTEETFRKSY